MARRTHLVTKDEAVKVIKKVRVVRLQLTEAKRYWNDEAKKKDANKYQRDVFRAKAAGIQIAQNYLEEIENSIPRRITDEHVEKAVAETSEDPSGRN